MDKLFGNIKMKWVTVLLFAIIAGVYTGLINSVSFLDDTSFQDIAITYEWWVVFAVIVVVNCEKPIEAAIKCFVFFLISQPLVYLTEVLLNQLSFELGFMYYKSIWLPMTFLTLPGGFVAFFAKKQNALGSIVLGIGNTIIAIMGIGFVSEMARDFPHHLLSIIFCIFSIITMTLSVQKEKKNRVITFLTVILLTGAVVVFAVASGRSLG